MNYFTYQEARQRPARAALDMTEAEIAEQIRSAITARQTGIQVEEHEWPEG